MKVAHRYGACFTSHPIPSSYHGPVSCKLFTQPSDSDALAASARSVSTCSGYMQFATVTSLLEQNRPLSCNCIFIADDVYCRHT